MKLITVATHSESYFPLLEESCLKNNLELTVLGLGQKWQGFSWKYKLISEYIEDLPLDEIVIFTDAFDVIVLNNTNNLIQTRFLEFETDIVVSVSNIKNPILSKISNKMFPKCQNNNINSGLYMGRVFALKQMFEDMCFMFDCSNFKLDDQTMLSMLCPVYIKVDEKSYIFYNYDILNEDIIYKSDKILTESGTEPCIIQGPRNQNLDKIAEIYGYKPDNFMNIDQTTAIVKRIPLYIHFFYFEILCFVFICISIYFITNFLEPSIKT